MYIHKSGASALASLLIIPGLSAAEPPTAPADSVSALDELWSLTSLYKNERNPVIEEFKLRGRYQGQHAWLDSNRGNFDDWENRRSRFGFDASLWDRQIEIRLDAQSNDGFDPLYDRLVDAYLRWKPSGTFSLTLGRQKPQIGYYDWLQSTSSQPTFERSQIFNQLRVDRTTGIAAEGRAGLWSWQSGIYANDVDREFGTLAGGVSWGAGFGYDFAGTLDLKKAAWRLDWLHSGHDEGDTVLNRYDNLFSSTLWLKDGRWSLVTEAFYATGNFPDVFGIFVQPAFDVAPEKLQLVGRCTFTAGDGPESVTAQTRYERSAPDLTGGGKGRSYQAGYLGLQYFIHGEKLKLLAGAEYSRLSGGRGGDFHGVTVLTGIRFSF